MGVEVEDVEGDKKLERDITHHLHTHIHTQSDTRFEFLFRFLHNLSLSNTHCGQIPEY